MKRIEILDSLRGFALLLILLYHSLYNFGAVYPGEETFLAFPGLDALSTSFIFHFVADRAFAVFSVIFGISFFIQLNKRSESEKFSVFLKMGLDGLGLASRMQGSSNDRFGGCLVMSMIIDK